MSVVVTIFALIIGSALQGLLPGWGGMGYAKPPILLGVVIYYALTRPRSAALTVALLTGFYLDALGPSPLGCSALPYFLIALLINSYRDEVFILHPITHALFGAAAAMGADLITAALLALLVPGSNMAVSTAMARSLGSAMLGAVTVPVVYQLLWRLDRALGHVDSRGVSWQ